jgi:predicted flap endonuclease-1-like 5' DNA nuclease
MTQGKPPTTTKLTSGDQRRRREDRLTSIRLRMAIGHELDARGITTPAAIGEALEMPADEAMKLMTGRVWREGTVAQLEAAAARLGVTLPDQ